MMMIFLWFVVSSVKGRNKFSLSALGGFKDVFAKNLSVYTKKVKLRDICAESQTISSSHHAHFLFLSLLCNRRVNWLMADSKMWSLVLGRQSLPFPRGSLAAVRVERAAANWLVFQRISPTCPRPSPHGPRPSSCSLPRVSEDADIF